MPRRWFDTDEWKRPWFRGLTSDAKVLLQFIRAWCDNAGFWDIDADDAIHHTGLTKKEAAKAFEALKPLYETNGQALWLKYFLFEQRNFPLNENNKAHLEIIRLLGERQDFSPLIVDILAGKRIDNPYNGNERSLFEGGLLSPPKRALDKGPCNVMSGNSNVRIKNKESKYSLVFEETWQKHWIPMGRNDVKREAHSQWMTTVKSRRAQDGREVTERMLADAAANYHKAMIREKRTAAHIMQPRRFYGVNQPWEDFVFDRVDPREQRKIREKEIETLKADIVALEFEVRYESGNYTDEGVSAMGSELRAKKEALAKLERGVGSCT